MASWAGGTTAEKEQQVMHLQQECRRDLAREKTAKEGKRVALRIDEERVDDVAQAGAAFKSSGQVPTPHGPASAHFPTTDR